MSKGKKEYQLWVGVGLLSLITVLIVVVVINVMGGETAGDVMISGGAAVDGLTCKNRTLGHPAFKSKPAISYLNIVTAVFQDDKLRSISLLAEGTYESSEVAKEARAFAGTGYDLTLANEYGEKIDIFSANFTVDGAKLQLAQTTRDIGKINTNTVTYFLLDQGTYISKSLDGLKKQYESKGFSCTKN